MPPLVAINRAELARLVGPFVPDGDAALLQPAHVRLAAQEPQKLVQDGLEVQLLRGEERKARFQAETQLSPEYGQRAGSGAIGLVRAALEHVGDEVEVLLLAAVIRHGVPRS